MRLKWNFQRGGVGDQTKTPLWEGCGFLLTVHIVPNSKALNMIFCFFFLSAGKKENN